MLIICLSLLPCIIWLTFFYVQNRYSREPLWLVATSFILGIFSTIPALICNTIGMALVMIFFGNSVFSQFLLFFGIVGPVEEMVKMLAVLIFAYRQPDFDEPIDGIIYSAAAALGFAAAENVLYVNQFNSIHILAFRGPLANAGHALFAAMWGLALSKAKATPKLNGRRTQIILLGWLAAATIHGSYDFILTLLSNRPAYVALAPIILLTGGMFFYVEYKVVSFLKTSPKKPTSNLLKATLRCPNCGELGKAKMICRKCKTRMPDYDMGEMRPCGYCQAQNPPGALQCGNCHYSLLSRGDGFAHSVYPHLIRIVPSGKEELACVLDKHIILIGKTLDNDFVIEDDLVENRHAKITWHPMGVHVIQDLNSTNGCFVNGQRVQEGYLQNGYEVRFGQTRFIYRAQPRI